MTSSGQWPCGSKGIPGRTLVLDAFDKHHLELDRTAIWHPYTSMQNPLPVYPVVSAQGVRLKLADGRELIDGMSSWWAAIHGYNHPQLNAAVQNQIESMSHVMFGGLTHRPAIDLADQLISLSPASLEKIFFCDSGSVAVEVAIKMVIQYWYAKGKPEKTKLLTIRSGYHGDTFGAMSVCDPVTGMHEIFANVLPRHFFADAPRTGFDEAFDESDCESLATILNDNQREIGGIILEPIVQGAGGMRIYSPHYLRRVRQLCDDYGILLILDEIATGFGRTGKMFASEHAQIEPDIMCVGKALTGGYMSLAATLASRKVSDGIASDGAGVFMHGPTFMANPLACSVALASLKLLLERDWAAEVSAIETQLREELTPCGELPGVRNVRALGAIGVVECENAVDVGTLQKVFVDKGVWVRPFSNLIYIMPPYIIEASELRELTSAITHVVATG
ncbi:MAG: adenosylmethionine--8-amino-7-oxononanoate transaminase [Halieaceae bacterium]|jgi:adenosylmethionine---8-amino-7-oxononanoate aminotransferase|nr:adenosylmethionine--8-amino-7-oxononanoate transaminase [Halieaceae bacterium]